MAKPMKNQIDKSLLKVLEELKLMKKTPKSINNIKKIDLGICSSDIRAWFKNNDLVSAYLYEGRQREKNFNIILKSKVGLGGWNKWMMKVGSSKSIPNILPLFSNLRKNELKTLRDNLEEKIKIETKLYHFDFNGDPLTLIIEFVLHSIHGMVKNMENIISTIKDLLK